MRIGDVLAAKNRHDVITIRPEASVRDLLGQLAEHNVGALIVSSDGATLQGIVSERDVVRRLTGGDAVLDQPVSAIMTAQVETCSPDVPLDELMQTMTEHRVRHVPVVHDGRIAGIISIGDVVKHKLDQLQFERDQLDNYLHQT